MRHLAGHSYVGGIAAAEDGVGARVRPWSGRYVCRHPSTLCFVANPHFKLQHPSLPLAHTTRCCQARRCPSRSATSSTHTISSTNSPVREVGFECDAVAPWGSLLTLLVPVHPTSVTVDSFRYFLMRDSPFGGDLTFSETALALRHNAELADTFGNLVNRSITLCAKYNHGRIPSEQAEAGIVPWPTHNAHQAVCTQHSMPRTAEHCVCYRYC